MDTMNSTNLVSYRWNTVDDQSELSQVAFNEIQSKVSHAMVFTNEVVQEIAQKKPRTMADFQNIHGVNRSGQGEQKAEKYGEPAANNS